MALPRLRQAVVAGDDHPAVADAAEVLRGKEGQAPHRRQGAGEAAVLEHRPQRLSGILDDGNPDPAGQCEDARHVAALAVEMDRHDGLHAALHAGGETGPHALERRRAQVVTGGIDVHEDRHRVQPRDDPRGGEEGVRRGEDVIAGADLERHERGEERVGARRHPDPVPRADVVRHGLLEDRYLRAHDELLGLEHAVDGLADLVLDRRVLGLEIEQRDLHRVGLLSANGSTRSPSIVYWRWQSGQAPRPRCTFSRTPHSHIQPAIRAGAPSTRA